MFEMRIHPVVMVFAAIGAVVLSWSAEKAASSDDCCSGSKWQAHTAAYKRDTLWSNIMENLKSNDWPGVSIGFLFVESMDPSFDRVADNLPWDRSKLIHSVGSVAEVTWVANNNSLKYSGILGSGGNYGIIRLSLAGEADVSKGSDPSQCDPNCGFVPGLGLKMLRNSVLSANIFSMYSLVGQPSFNFFRNNFTNHPTLLCSDVHGSLKLLYDKFRTASQWPTTVGLLQLAEFDENGVKADPPRYPFQLWLVPNPDLTNAYPDQPIPGWSDQTLASQLRAIPAGTVLYTIYGVENPHETAEVIGYLQTSSAFTTSMWGDKDLFFEHTRMEDDLILHPAWKSALPDGTTYC